VYILCIEELVWKFSGFLTTDSVSATIYKLGTVSMSHFLNPPLQELLGPSLSMIIIIISSSSSSISSIKNTMRMVVDELRKIIP
jgi:hypothetical protein